MVIADLFLAFMCGFLSGVFTVVYIIYKRIKAGKIKINEIEGYEVKAKD